MKPKYLTQIFIIALMLAIYMISAACNPVPTPVPNLDESNPSSGDADLAETMIQETEYTRATEAGTIFAEATDAAKTRQASGTPRMPTSSRTPTAMPSNTPSKTPSPRPTEIPTATDDPNKPTLSFAERKATQDHDPTFIKRRTDQAANALNALLVQGGPPDVPGWDGPSQVTRADPTHLEYLLEQEFLLEKLPDIYSDLMPKYGWTTQGSNATTMTFTKEGRTATVTFSLEPDHRVKVSIVIA